MTFCTESYFMSLKMKIIELVNVCHILCIYIADKIKIYDKEEVPQSLRDPVLISENQPVLIYGQWLLHRF